MDRKKNDKRHVRNLVVLGSLTTVKFLPPTLVKAVTQSLMELPAEIKRRNKDVIRSSGNLPNSILNLRSQAYMTWPLLKLLMPFVLSWMPLLSKDR
ncbi:unnamed protein product [Camellia sinensis]